MYFDNLLLNPFVVEVLVEDWWKVPCHFRQCERSAVAIAWGFSPPRGERGVASVLVNSLPREAGYFYAPAAVLCWATSPQFRPLDLRCMGSRGSTFQCWRRITKTPGTTVLHIEALRPSAWRSRNTVLLDSHRCNLINIIGATSCVSSPVNISDCVCLPWASATHHSPHTIGGEVLAWTPSMRRLPLQLS